MTESLCLLSVHAHPDDEASKGAGTVARYHALGVHTVLVTCTGGEEGEILNPAVNLPEYQADLAAVRRQELERAAQIIGYDELVMLGYRDSGMADSEANLHPESFVQAPFEEAVERLVKVIRRVHPQVVITYPEEQRGYRHPDHLRVHEISRQAFDAAGDPEQFPLAGAPFVPSKLYYSVWAKDQFLARHGKFVETGIESPYSAGMFTAWFDREEIASTTRIDLDGFTEVRTRALLAHETQIDPASNFWFGLPAEVEQEIFSYDLYVLAKSNVSALDVHEEDLFENISVTSLR
ncbi:MAG TPA: PIG-L family deacetylase [Acidimicrobiales bacterium]|nr:PIG-L family deacetylase [Acidimicrobiales bacterium]